MSEIHASVVLRTNIAKMTDQKSTRFAFGSIHVCPAGDNQVVLTATDGRAMAITWAAGNADKPRLLPASILPKVGRKPALATLNGQWQCGNRVEHEADSRYPDVTTVLSPVGQDVITVNLDASILKRLAESLNEAGEAEAVTLFIDRNSPPVVHEAIPVSTPYGIGVIMPRASDSGNDEKDREQLVNNYNRRLNRYREQFRQS